MQKSLELLKRYVQWIVLGVALLFIGWMAYSYFVSAPSSIILKIDGQELLPGEVDPYIKEHTVKKLVSAMSSPAGPDRVTQIDWVSGFGRDINPEVAIKPIDAEDKTPPPPPPVNQFAPKLVVAPAPKFEAEVHGRSIVIHPDFAFKPDPKNPNPVVPVIQEDVDWVSLAFRVQMGDLNKAFDAANIPKDPAIHMTQFFRVVLYRQEQLANGTWTKLLPLLPLPSQRIAPLPDEKATRAQYFGYMDWAHKNLQTILRPAFYDIVAGKGTAWREPAVAAPAAPAGPATAPTTAPTTTPATSLLDLTSSAAKYCADEPAPPPAPEATGQGSAPAAVPLPGAAAADGRFDPANAPDALIIVHDPTALSGKVYRYEMIYYILNPVWKTMVPLPGVDPKVADRFAIFSAFSDPSPAIDIEARVKFWVQNVTNSRGRPQVKFDVFTDNPAGKKKELVTAEPGDDIGASGWTVVDVRAEKNVTYVLVSDSNGHVIRRDKLNDDKDPDHVKLLNAAAPQVGAAQ